MIKQFKKALNLFLFLISAFAASNVFSSTNDIHSDYQNQIDAITAKYALQWDVLTKNADELALSINKEQNAQNLLDELMKRIKDKNDPLDNLQKYEPIIYDSASAHLIYGTAYDMLWNKDNGRSAKLFAFLINDKNPNKFTVGNSHYWLARYLYIFKEDNTNGLNHYLMVHKYPACLVFTDNAYLTAGKIYRKWNKNDIAFGEHSAIMPEEIVKRCVRLFTYIGDIVLDPFTGSGTTLKVAKELKRNYVGYEISKNYEKVIKLKLQKTLF